MKLITRLASPAGFGLALLLFLVLPFVSVSCEMSGFGSVAANYSGADLAVAGAPSYEVTGMLAEEFEQAPEEDRQALEEVRSAAGAGAQVLAIVTALLLVVGLGTALLARVRARQLGAAGTAIPAGILLIATQLTAQAGLESAVLENGTGQVDNGSGEPLFDLDISPEDLVGSETGFWLCLFGLAVIAAGNLIAVFLARARRAAPAPVPGPDPPPPSQPNPPPVIE